MKKVILTAAFSALATAASAQVSSFEGLFLNVNAELKSTNVKFSDTTSSFSGFGSANTIGSIGAEYATEMGGILMLLGGKYDLGSTSIISFSTTSASLTMKEKSHFQVYVAPAKVLSPDSIAYVKLGYDKSKGEVAATGAATESSKINGVTLAAGLRTRIVDNVFFNVEAGRTNYSTKSLTGTNADAAATYGMVGLSIKY